MAVRGAMSRQPLSGLGHRWRTRLSQDRPLEASAGANRPQHGAGAGPAARPAAKNTTHIAAKMAGTACVWSTCGDRKAENRTRCREWAYRSANRISVRPTAAIGGALAPGRQRSSGSRRELVERPHPGWRHRQPSCAAHAGGEQTTAVFDKPMIIIRSPRSCSRISAR